MSAIIRLNPDRSEFEAELPDGSVFQEDFPDDGLAVLLSEDGSPFLAAFEGNEAGLQSNTIYKLSPIGTTVETDVEFDDEEEDEDNDEDEDDVAEEPPAA